MPLGIRKIFRVLVGGLANDEGAAHDITFMVSLFTVNSLFLSQTFSIALDEKFSIPRKSKKW